MSNYPFIKCLRPRKIVNRYTGDILTVGCGCCSACTLNRQRKMSLQCQLEETYHKYSMFTTLTFSPESVPYLQPLYSRRRKGYVLYNLCSRYTSQRGCSQSFFIDMSPVKMNMLLKKLNCNGLIPYCNKTDLQLFIKRLRKYLSKYTYEQIRYYAVSEYGPIHFRPHFHIIFYFDSDVIAEHFGEAIRNAWSFKEKKANKKNPKKSTFKIRPYGRVDYSQSRGKINNYVAGYVNSSCTLPRLYENSTLKPFCVHSTYFAHGVYKGSEQEITKLPFEKIIQTCTSITGKIVNTPLFSSYLSRFFPRCKGYNDKSYVQLYQSYTLFERARYFYGETCVHRLAKNIFLDCHLDPIYRNPITEYFTDYIHSLDFQKVYNDVELGNKVIQRIENELYLSKRFLHILCGCDPRLVNIRLNNIIDFYNDYNIYKLRQFYEQQIKFADTYPNDLDGLRFFFDNVEDFKHYETLPDQTYSPFKVSDFYFFDKFVHDTNIDFDNSIKHKKQNDLNKIFL